MNENISLDGSGYTINADINKFSSLSKGTIVVKFKPEGSGIRSLISFSNSERNNEHFHVYI